MLYLKGRFLTLIIAAISLFFAGNQKNNKETIYEKEFSINNKVDHTNTNWYLEMKSETSNVTLAQQYYQAYFETHPKEMSKQRKLFMRWYTIARLNVDEQGFQIAHKVEKYSEIQHKKIANGLKASSGTWRMLGPNYAEKTRCNGLSNYMSGGYVDRVYINPFNTQNMFAGFSYGGLWVSQDQGSTWTLTDGEFPNGTNSYANNDRYYGDIKACQAMATTVYAASEAGLLKSTDSGANWNYCNELNRTVDVNTRPYFVAVAPDNPDVLVSTFGKNVYKSSDGGNTWALTFDNSNGGPNNTFTSQHVTTSYGLYARTYNFFGLEADFSNPDVFYLGLWNGNDEPCIYKSTNKGDSFSLLINLNTANNRNMPGNLKLQTTGVSGGNFHVYPEWMTGDIIYTYNENGILASQKVFNTNSQAGDISWDNEEIIYNGYYASSAIEKTTDGGTTFTDLMSGSYGGCPDGNKYVHADVRAIDAVGDLILIGTDGGMSLTKDGLQTAISIGDQITAVDLWGFASSEKSDICVAGMDHGPSTIRKYDGLNGWHERGGGDAIHASVNQSHDRWVYYDTQYGVYREYVEEDGTLSQREQIYAPFNVNHLEFHPNIYTIGYGISNQTLYRALDNFSAFETMFTFTQNISRFKISADDANVMYVLLSNEQVKKSTDAGQTWTDISPPTANFVDISLGDTPDEIYLAIGNWQNSNKILKSADGGSTWANFTSSNLPTAPVSAITHQSGTDGGVYMAFAGMHGVWYRNNQMAEWEELGNGLPMFGYVKNIFAVPNKGKYRMGSSRGSWEHDLYENSAPIARFAVKANTTCTSETIKFIQNSVVMPGAVSYQWSFPGGNPAISNDAAPEVGYAVPGYYDVSLTLTDENGLIHTRTLNDFIEVTGCGNEFKIPDGGFSCENPILESTWIDEGTEIMIKDFATEGGESFYVNLKAAVDCDSTVASLKAIIDIPNQRINVIEYIHFNSYLLDPMLGEETDKVTSFYSTTGQIEYRIDGTQLYLKLVSSTCGTTGRLSASCWSDLCDQSIAQTNFITGGQEIMIKDFASENSNFFHLNLNAYVNCYAKTATFEGVIDIVNQKFYIIDYDHFGTTSNAIEGNETAIVNSVSTSYGKIEYRIEGTELYFKLISNACGSSGRLDASCWASIDPACDLAAMPVIETGAGIIACSGNAAYLGVEVDNVSDYTLSWSNGQLANCTEILAQSPNLYQADGDLLISDFCQKTNGEYYVDLEVFTNCYNLTASFKGVVDLTNNIIKVIEYIHFNETIPVEMTGDGGNTVISPSAAYAQIKLRADGSNLYLNLENMPCGPAGFIRIQNGNMHSIEAISYEDIGEQVVFIANENGCIIADSVMVTLGVDSDQDGVCDVEDNCPTEFGDINYNGCPCLAINLHVLLEGAYEPSIEEMTTELNNTLSILPGQTPGNALVPSTLAGQPYHIAPWNHTGTEGANWTSLNYTDDVVDWILVSFRTGIEKSTEVARLAALLNKDGSVSFPDDCTFAPVTSAPLYIVVEHRNHMGVMSTEAISIMNNTLTYDFRLSDSYRNVASYGQKLLANGVWAMYTGDANKLSDALSYDINGLDKFIWAEDTGIFYNYIITDFNLNGDVNGADKALWLENNGVFSSVLK